MQVSFFNLKFHRQSMLSQPPFRFTWLALQGLVSAENIFERPRLYVVIPGGFHLPKATFKKT